jgi:hypothetical protein
VKKMWIVLSVLFIDTSFARESLLLEREGSSSSSSSSSSSASSPHHKRCQSSARCFYSSMPTYYQSHNDLKDYIARQVNTTSMDIEGLCVPTSAAMLLKAVLDERSSKTVLNNSFLEGYQARPWYENVYRIGKKAGTNFKDGGTFTPLVNSAFKNYFKSTKADIGLKWYKDGLLLGKADITNDDLIQSIRKDKFAYLIGVGRHVRKSKKFLTATNVWYKRESGHGLVVKGYDSDRLHIQDPWGTEYFARIKRDNFKVASIGLGNRHSHFIPVENKGWMGYYAEKDRRLVLDELIGISLD